MLYVHVLHLLHWGLFLILGLNILIVALDAAAEKGLSNRDSFKPEQKKSVIIDVPSSLDPHLIDAPEWALNPDYQTNDKGNVFFDLCILHQCLCLCT